MNRQQRIRVSGLIAAVLASVLMWTMSAPAAFADTGTTPVAAGAPHLPERPADDMFGTSGSGICSSFTGSSQPSSSDLLPINRWGGVADRHTRLSTFSNLTSYGSGTMMVWTYGSGNTAWQASSTVTAWASRLCFADTMGTTADKWVAAVGGAITGSPLIVILLVVGLVIVAVRRRSIQGVGRVLLAAALLGVMISGAGKTNGTQYGVGSPGWITNIVNRAVSTAASAPAAAMNGFVATSNESVTKTSGTTSSVLSCDRYTADLNKRYSASFGTADFSSIIPQSVNSMWQETGLKTYIAMQFGEHNTYGAKVYCRLLDMQSGRPLAGDTGVVALTQEAGFGSATNTGSLNLGTEGYPFNVATDSSKVDRAMVAWAACNVAADGTVSVDPEWAKVLTGDAVGDCKKFFSNGFTLDGSSVFEFTDDPSKIDKDVAPKSEAVADYLHALHGDYGTGTGSTVAGAYAVTAIIALIVFGVFAIAVVVAKIGMIGVTFLLVFSALSWMVRADSEGSPLLASLKQYASLTLFAYVANLILSVIALLSNGITAGSGGMGTMSGVLASGLAPLASVLIVHFFFTKGLKAPSPFKLTSAIDYAKRAGNGQLAGDALNGAGGLLRRGSNAARNYGSGVARRGADNMLNRVTGGKFGRRGGMGPLGTAATAAVGGAVGGAVAEKLGEHTQDQRDKQADQGPLSRDRQGPPMTRDEATSAHDGTLGKAPTSPARPKPGDAVRWARTGYRPGDGAGDWARASLSMAGKSVTDRAKAAKAYWAANRAKLARGAAGSGALAAGAGAAYVAGAAGLLATPLAIPAAVALTAVAARKTARMVRDARTGTADQRRAAARQLESQATRMYTAKPRRAVGDPEVAPRPVAAKRPVPVSGRTPVPVKPVPDGNVPKMPRRVTLTAKGLSEPPPPLAPPPSDERGTTAWPTGQPNPR